MLHSDGVQWPHSMSKMFQILLPGKTSFQSILLDLSP